MHDKLTSRHLIEGPLILDTALHIGGGVASLGVQSDSPVYRDHVGRPLIPGSSMKGAFRSSIERLMHMGRDAPVWICGTPGGCLPDEHIKTLRQGWERDGVDIDEALSTLLLGQPGIPASLCHACRLFGYPSLAGRALFADLALQGDQLNSSEIRDGVAIDRDTGRAVEGLKYDFEVIPAGTRFTFKLTVENAQPADLCMIAVGLLEFGDGMIPLGGMRTRGLGHCHLDLDQLTIRSAELATPKDVLAYLRGGRDAMTLVTHIRQHLQSWIDQALTGDPSV